MSTAMSTVKMGKYELEFGTKYLGNLRDSNDILNNVPALQARIVETHPEVAFWAMNEENPLPLPKRVKSRPFAPGLSLRRDLLEKAGVALGAFDTKSGVAAEDDFIDAAACAVVAERVRTGVARRFPDHPQIDERGLRMEIWA